MLTDNYVSHHTCATNRKIPYPVRDRNINLIHVHDEDNGSQPRKQRVELGVRQLHHDYECVNIKEARVIQHVRNSLLDSLFALDSIYNDYNTRIAATPVVRSGLKSFRCNAYQL